VTLAFELPVSRNLKLILLLILAIWKAMLVADVLHASQVRALAAAADLYRAVALAVILVTVVIMEKVF